MPNIAPIPLGLFMVTISVFAVALGWMLGRMRYQKPLMPISLFLLWLALTGSLPYLIDFTGIGVAAQFPSFALTLVGMLALGVSRFGERLILANGLALVAAVQVFRLPLEYVLLLWYGVGFMPVQMTFMGDNFDIVTGVIALPAAILIARSSRPLLVALAFNLVGFGFLLRIVWIVALSSPTPLRDLLGGYETGPDVLVGLYFPTVWIASVGVAGAFLLHVSSLAFVIRRRRNGGL